MPGHPLHAPVLAWYAECGRALPWRAADRSPWGVLVSEVMLQQTPVARVLPVWQEWMARWPAPADLAAEVAGEAIRAWGRLGYPRRALRLHEAAVEIVARHGGRVPAGHADLLALPGVGTYTAAAVACFAFGQRQAVLDTNVRRVLARAVDGSPSAPPAPTAAERRLAERVLPESDEVAATWAVAAMELGALVCTARAPRCRECPAGRLCRWRAAGSPPGGGPPRRGQPWAGTDRQVRGRILALLREAADPVTAADLVGAVPEADLRDPGQRDRCLDGLVADGLVQPLDDARFALPGLVQPLDGSHPAPPGLGPPGTFDTRH